MRPADISKTTGEWVSVKDRLPDKVGTYLVNVHEEFTKDEDSESGDLVLLAWYQPNDLIYVPKSVGWHMLYEFYEFSDQMRDEITHWMPLPNPPENIDD